MITINDFSKVELKVGTVLEAEEVPGSEKLIKMKVDLGSLDVIPSKEGIQLEKKSNGSPIRLGMTKEDRDIRQILSGIKKWYKPGKLIGKQIIVIANLEPRMMMGYESQGMVLAVGEEKPVLLKPSSKVIPGSKVR